MKIYSVYPLCSYAYETQFQCDKRSARFPLHPLLHQVLWLMWAWHLPAISSAQTLLHYVYVRVVDRMEEGIA